MTERIGTIGKPLYHHWSARDYVQSGLVAMWDGIENAGWGVHADLLPVRYGMSNLCNLVTPTIPYNGSDYDFGLNVYGMSVTPDGLSWDSTGAWLGWGIDDNTNQVPNGRVAESALSSLIPTVDGTQAVTVECVARLDPNSSAKAMSLMVTGYNERAIYTSYSTTGNAYARWRVGGTVRYDLFQSPFKGGTQVVTMVQSSAEGRVYVDGVSVFSRSGTCDAFFLNQVNFLRANAVNHPFTPSGKFHSLRIYSRALTASEIAHNYRVDKLRFGIP